METKEALTRFLIECEERGLSPTTIRHYHGYLRHFANEYPELPTDTRIIELYLKKRKETPAHRGDHFKHLQAFYSYLERIDGIKSPVPAKGPMGRPHKSKLVITPASEQLDGTPPYKKVKVVTGGSSVSSSTSISTVDAVQAFIKSRQVQGVSKRTLEGYYSYFKPFILQFPILPITTEQIEGFLASLKVDPETKWSYNKTLKALYHFLEDRKKLPKDLVILPRIKVTRKVRRVLSEDELRQLFSYTQNFLETAILTTLIDTKIRASELCSLHREKVYPDHITVTGKTGERDAPISPATYGLLIQLAPSGPLFTVNGKPMKREYLRIMLRRLMERAGLTGERLGPHILRHSSSVQHMMFGGDLLSLKEELGHTTTRMTEVYGRLAFPQVKQKHGEVNILGRITSQANLERAVCYGCGQQIVIAWLDVKKTECPNCHQVGNWYAPDHHPLAVEQEGARK